MKPHPAAEIFPLIRQNIQTEFSKCALYSYKLIAGGHLRLHKDDYAGHTGFIW